MQLDRRIAYKAKDVASLAYHNKQFEYGRDSFYIDVLHDKKEIYVGITGSNDKYDWWDNFIAFTKWFLDIVCAHARWFKRAESFSGFLNRKIAEQVPDVGDYNIIVAGHSYGGAAAQDFTLLNVNVKLCITFNSPLPWRKFRHKASELLMREKVHHFVNTADSITSMPFRNRRFGREYLWRVNVRGNDHGIDLNDEIIDKYFPEVV